VLKEFVIQDVAPIPIVRPPKYVFPTSVVVEPVLRVVPLVVMISMNAIKIPVILQQIASILRDHLNALVPKVSLEILTKTDVLNLMNVEQILIAPTLWPVSLDQMMCKDVLILVLIWITCVDLVANVWSPITLPNVFVQQITKETRTTSVLAVIPWNVLLTKIVLKTKLVILP
jgi:hypothetical protein